MTSNIPPTGAEQLDEASERPFAEHFRHVAHVEGFDVAVCESRPDDTSYFPYYVDKLYWWADEDGWCLLPMSYEAGQQRNRRRELRHKAAELAAPVLAQVGGAALFPQAAQAAYDFLMKD